MAQENNNGGSGFHVHPLESNVRDCFRQFVGHKIVGFLFDTFPLGRSDLAAGTKTFIFDCGYGLTVAPSGAYWIENPIDIKRSIPEKLKHFENVQKDLEGVRYIQEMLKQR